MRSPRLYHGTKAALRPGDLIEPGPLTGDGRQPAPPAAVSLTSSLDAAAWQGELAPGEGPGRVYLVEPTGVIVHGADTTQEAYPTHLGPWYRSQKPLRVPGEVTDRQGRPQRLYHGTKADLKPGDLIEPGYSPNFGRLDRTTTYVYLAGTLDAATWGAELAAGNGPGRIYIVEPTGPMADDPNLTNKRYPGNPTKSYRSRKPLRVVGEVRDWQGHPPEALEAMKESLERLRQQGVETIDD